MSLAISQPFAVLDFVVQAEEYLPLCVLFMIHNANTPTSTPPTFPCTSPPPNPTFRKDVDHATDSCYKAAAMYAATMMISVGMIVKNSRTSRPPLAAHGEATNLMLSTAPSYGGTL